MLCLTWFDKLIPNFHFKFPIGKKGLCCCTLRFWFACVLGGSDWGPFFCTFLIFCYPKLVPVMLCSCVNRLLFRPVTTTTFLLQDVCFWSEGALEPDEWWWPLSSWWYEDWRNDFLTCIFFTHWFHLHSWMSFPQLRRYQRRHWGCVVSNLTYLN